MKAVILAAGEGSRMRPLTDVRPKVMLPVANKPIIEHLFNILVDAGVKEIVVVTGYQASQLEQYFGNGNKWGAVVEY
ncbi:MAG: sugar phosphate nucleotidyltransferase, partial [Dehalococcoidales bacterium]|nr:sugar phosphate nucleotidyltransferase [Dehalococcoidales bacterium]